MSEPFDKLQAIVCNTCGHLRKFHGGNICGSESWNCNCGYFTMSTQDTYTRVHRARLVHPDDLDVCGFCGEGGADKIPAPLQYEGQMDAETSYVHQECEQEEETRCAKIEWEQSARTVRGTYPRVDQF